MMKLVALSLLVCEGNAFQNLGARVDELEAQAQVVKGLVQCLSEATAQHCDQTCADVIAISSRPFPTIESGTSYEVDAGCVDIKILRRVRAESTAEPTAKPSIKPTAAHYFPPSRPFLDGLP